jgi:hypothetical protein
VYLTVHKVRSPTLRVGTNAFTYVHDPDAPIDWNHPDISQIATSLPGRRTEAAVEIAPGGNTVISYLDVAAANGTPYEVIRQALEAAEHQIDGRDSVLIPGPIAIRFGTELGNAPNARSEFSHLRGRLLEILDRHMPWQRQSPLVIVERRVDTGRVFGLDDASAARIQARRDGWQRLPLHISGDVAADFEQIHGPIRMHAAELLTGLSGDEILEMGGYRIVDTSGREQLRWPTLPAADDVTETIAGQVTGYWFGPRDEIPPRPEGRPTGAVLAELGGTLYTAPCLDLVLVNYLWVPLSMTGAPTYMHAAGLMAQETWRFVLADEPWPSIAIAELATPLPPTQIQAKFGIDAHVRARHDREAVQIRFRRERG